MTFEIDLDVPSGILHVRPGASLHESDFDAVARVADPHIERHGALNGLILEFDAFPGWEDLDALRRHFRFVRDHHRSIEKLAVVTDSPVGAFAERLADHFVAATIRRFPSGEVGAARDWITGS